MKDRNDKTLQLRVVQEIKKDNLENWRPFLLSLQYRSLDESIDFSDITISPNVRKKLSKVNTGSESFKCNSKYLSSARRFITDDSRSFCLDCINWIPWYNVEWLVWRFTTVMSFKTLPLIHYLYFLCCTSLLQCVLPFYHDWLWFLVQDSFLAHLSSYVSVYVLVQWSPW